MRSASRRHGGLLAELYSMRLPWLFSSSIRRTSCPRQSALSSEPLDSFEHQKFWFINESACLSSNLNGIINLKHQRLHSQFIWHPLASQIRAKARRAQAPQVDSECAGQG